MDKFSKQRRSEIMSKIRSKDTRPEKVVRSALHALGFRFRLHREGLPGKPDVVLAKWKAVILIHGCFWHGCPSCDRGRRVPKTTTAFWVKKVAENQRRDATVRAAMESRGWRVIVVWACETRNAQHLAQRLGEVRGVGGRSVEGRRSGRIKSASRETC